MKNNIVNDNTVPNEPTGYFLNTSAGGTNILSEKFTSYDLSPDELSAKGNGGRRPMYNYISAQDGLNVINTPPDTYN